jgi:hypothetical protein
MTYFGSSGGYTGISLTKTGIVIGGIISILALIGSFTVAYYIWEFFSAHLRWIS